MRNVSIRGRYGYIVLKSEEGKEGGSSNNKTRTTRFVIHLSMLCCALL